MPWRLQAPASFGARQRHCWLDVLRRRNRWRRPVMARAAGVSPAMPIGGQRSPTSSKHAGRGHAGVRDHRLPPQHAARSLASPVLHQRASSGASAPPSTPTTRIRRGVRLLKTQQVRCHPRNADFSAPIRAGFLLNYTPAYLGGGSWTWPDGDEREAMLLEEGPHQSLIGSEDRARCRAPALTRTSLRWPRRRGSVELGHRHAVALIRETASDDAHARQDQAPQLLRTRAGAGEIES